MSPKVGEAASKTPPVVQRVAFLDEIRGCAILAVFTFHALRAVYDRTDLIPWSAAGWYRDLWSVEAYKWLLLPFNSGNSGVAIFFVISGFCIHISYSRTQHQDPWFLGFMIRRVFRIYPPYLLALLVFSFVWPWACIQFGRRSDTLNFVSHVLLLHNYGPKSIFTGINSSFWSIAVEFQLYLLYPLLYWLGRQRGWRRAIAVSGAVELLIRSMVAVFSTWLILSGAEFEIPRGFTYSPLAFMLSWGIGAGIAEAYMKGEQLPLLRQSWIAWGLAALASAYVWPSAAFTFLLYAMATATFLSRSLHGERLIPSFPARGLLARHLRFVGMISYSLYLIHQPLLEAVKPLLRRLMPTHELHPVWLLTLCLATWPAVLLLSWLMYRTLEMPSQAWGRRLAKKVSR